MKILLNKNLMSVASSLLSCYLLYPGGLTGGMGIRDCAEGVSRRGNSR